MEAGKCYALIIEENGDRIFQDYDSEFESQVLMFEGFFESALQLGRDFSGKGYKHLDFGLIRFCVTHDAGLIYLVVTNENTSKKEGYQVLSDIIMVRQSDNKQLKDLLAEANAELKQIHELRTLMVELMEKKNISSDIVELDRTDLGINLNVRNFLKMDKETQYKKMNEILDTFVNY